MRAYLTTSLFLAIALVSTTPARAEKFKSSSLHSSILAVAEKAPDPQHNLAATRGRLNTAIKQLDHFLAGGGPDKVQGWNSWLQIPEMKAALEKDPIDVAELRSIRHRYFRNQPGLESPVFLKVREELPRLLSAEEFARSPSPADQYRANVLELSECVARLESAPSETDAQRTSELLTWLEQLGGDGVSLVAPIRAHHRHSNAYLHVSSPALNLYGQRQVSETRTIAEYVLGNFTRGVAYSQGRVTFGTAPSTKQGVLEIRFDGQVQCPGAVAEHGKITIHTSSTTNISARKQVQVTDQGIAILPATASGAANVNIQDVDARSRLVERIARKKANEMKPEASAAAVEKARKEVTAKLDSEVNAQLGGANNMYRDKVLGPMLRLGAMPGHLGFSTDQNHLHITLAQHNAVQLAAASQPPKLKVCDLGGTLHESAINNIAESLLAGRTVEDTAFHDMLHLLMGNAPRPLWVHDREEPWSITFQELRPVTANFAEDRIGLTLRLQSISRGEKTYPHPVEIAGAFRPLTTEEGPALVRDGEVTIRFPQPLPSEQEKELRTFLARKFSGVFPPELYFDGVVPPEGGQLGKLRQFKVAEFRSADHWLTLAYQLHAK